MDQLTSLFPRLGSSFGDIYLSNNPIGSEMKKMLKEKLEGRKESLYPNQVLSVPRAPSTSSSDGHSDQEDYDSDGEEKPLSFTKSSNDGDTKEEEEPLSAPHTLPRPHPLTTSQCADVHQESIGESGGRGNDRLRPDSEGEPAMEFQTTVNQSPLQDQVLAKCPNNVFVSSLPAESGTPATKIRRSEDTEPPEEVHQLPTTTDEVKPNKIVKSGKITDPDHLFNNISKQIFERYTEVGIQLGLTGEVLTDELETGEFKMLQGSRKALKMLQLWQRSVTEDDCTYSALAAALEKEGFTNCADKYCYTTELNQ